MRPGHRRTGANGLLAFANRMARLVIRFHDRQPLLAGTRPGEYFNFGARTVQEYFPLAHAFGAEPPGPPLPSCPPNKPASQPPPQPRLWERQPGESGRDFETFLAWLNLERRRPLSRAAATLDEPVSRLLRLSARHRWRRS